MVLPERLFTILLPLYLFIVTNVIEKCLSLSLSDCEKSRNVYIVLFFQGEMHKRLGFVVLLLSILLVSTVSAGFGSKLFEFFSETPDLRLSPAVTPSCWSLGDTSPVELSTYPDKAVPVSLSGDFVLSGMYQGVPFPNYYEDLMVFLTLADGSKGYRFRTSPSDTDTPHTALTRNPIALPSGWSCYGGASCLENSIHTLYSSSQYVPFSLSRAGNIVTWTVAGQTQAVTLNASFVGVPLSLNIASWNDRGKNFVSNVHLISASCTVPQPVVTCTDSDGGLDYSLRGTVVVSPQGNQAGVTGVDQCVDTLRLSERTCTSDGGIEESIYSCPNGCSGGACSSSSVLVNACSELSSALKANVTLRFSNASGIWKDNDGDVLHLVQTATVNKSQYIILGSDNINAVPLIYEVTQISNSTSGFDNDRVELRDISTGNSYTASITSEGQGNITLQGTRYALSYSGSALISERARTVQFVAPYTPRSYVGCSFAPGSSLTCTDSDAIYAGTEHPQGRNYFVRGNATYSNGVVTQDICSGTYVLEAICGQSPGSSEYACPNGCFDGACAYGSGELITLTSSNDLARVVVNGDVMTVRVVTATDSLARIELGEVDEVETASVELAVGTSTVLAGATIFLSDADADLGGFSVQFTVSAQGVCSELIDGVKHPDESFVGGDGVTYDLNYNDTWVSEEYTSYQSIWSSQSLVGDEATYLSLHVRVYANQSYVAGTRHPLYEKGCSVRDIEGNRVWVCSFEDSTGSSERTYSSLTVFWANRNVEVVAALEIGQTLSPEEVEKRVHDTLLAFNTQLQDNQFISSQGGDELFHKRGAPLLSDFLAECPSTIVATVDYSSLACKMEPVICPPHGYQTKICLRDGQEVSSSTYSCNPGICSGCMVPRWLGARGGDNVCLPYGTRLLTAVVDRETLRFQDLNGEEEFSVVFTDDYSGTITLNEDISNELSYLAVNGEQISLTKGTTFRFEEGMTYTIELADGYEDANHYTYVLTVEDIVRGSSDADSFLRLSFGGEKQPMYCNYDGSLNVQKVKDYNGDWAQCQNNYECESNVCSSGECIEVQSLLEQASGLKGFAIRLLCRFTNIFSAEGYNQCIAEAYGQ